MVPHPKDIKLALSSYPAFCPCITDSRWQKAGMDLRTRQLAKTHLLALKFLWSVCMLYFAYV